MDDGPGGLRVDCPDCGQMTIVVVPAGSQAAEDEKTADGVVWANCNDCGARFRVFYQLDE